MPGRNRSSHYINHIQQDVCHLKELGTKIELDVTPEEEAALKTSFIVKMCPFDAYVVRLVLHADISEDDVDCIVKKFQYIISEPPSDK